jgi:hypothetical protein
MSMSCPMPSLLRLSDSLGIMRNSKSNQRSKPPKLLPKDQAHQPDPSTNSTALFALSIRATVPPTLAFNSSSSSVPRCHVPCTSPSRSISPTSNFNSLAASASISSCFLTRASSSSLLLLNSSSNFLAVAPGASRRRLASCSVWFSICAESDCTRCASFASKGSISVYPA